MSYTPKELIATLERHDVYVTERKLTDWRQKGLLPSLKRIGRGRGKGTRWFWENDEVLQQAIAAKYFLSRKYRTRYALSNLWLAGFDVQTESGKEALLGEIANRKRFFEKPTARKVERLDGLLNSWNRIFTNEISNFEFDGREIIQLFVFKILDLIYHPDPEFDCFELVEFLSRFDGPPITEEDRNQGELFIAFIAQIMRSSSIYNLPGTIVETSNMRLENAVSAARVFRKIIFRALAIIRSERNVIMRIQQSAGLTSFIAPQLIIFHLMLQNNNSKKLLDNSLSIVFDALNILSVSDIILTQEPKILLSDRAEQVWGSVRSDLVSVWSDFEWDADLWTTASGKISNLN